jgi:hypothetical protein
MAEAVATRINALQRHLESIYRVRAPHDVDDFVITDPALARQLDVAASSREIDEKLLVQQDDDGIGVALYLEAELINRLQEDDPTDLLHDGNVVDFCIALEGVSHFLYLTWNAALDRSVTHLELEMQAEVDKYIAIATLTGRQRRLVPEHLHYWLFETHSFDERLADDDLERYREANHFAGKYCLRLERRFLRCAPRRLGMISELRQFYRLTLREKIRRIEHDF